LLICKFLAEDLKKFNPKGEGIEPTLKKAIDALFSFSVDSCVSWTNESHEKAAVCLTDSLFNVLRKQPTTQVTWWQPGYLRVPFRQILGVKNQLSDVITIIKYSPYFSEQENIYPNGTLSITPRQILEETFNKIKKVMRYRLRLYFERHLSNNLHIADITNGFWNRFEEEIFWLFLTGIRGGDNSGRDDSFKIESNLK
jgi:hypothetical protein